MSERRGRSLSRRNVIAAAVAAAPAAAAAQHEAHQQAPAQRQPPQQQKQRQQPFLTAHEFATLRTLCDLILPADEVSPAASAAGAPEYIDLLCRNNPELARIYHGGLAWLDATCNQLHGSTFRAAPAAAQAELLEKLAYREKTPPGWEAGAKFFDWARKMTLDAFYTSPIGYKDVGYVGGHGMTPQYQVPEAALRQALVKVKL